MQKHKQEQGVLVYRHSGLQHHTHMAVSVYCTRPIAAISFSACTFQVRQNAASRNLPAPRPGAKAASASLMAACSTCKLCWALMSSCWLCVASSSCAPARSENFPIEPLQNRPWNMHLRSSIRTRYRYIPHKEAQYVFFTWATGWTQSHDRSEFTRPPQPSTLYRLKCHSRYPIESVSTQQFVSRQFLIIKSTAPSWSLSAISTCACAAATSEAAVAAASTNAPCCTAEISASSAWAADTRNGSAKCGHKVRKYVEQRDSCSIANDTWGGSMLIAVIPKKG